MNNILPTLTLQKPKLNLLLLATRKAFDNKQLATTSYYNFTFCQNLTNNLNDQESIELTWLYVMLKTNQEAGHTSLLAENWYQFTKGWYQITNISNQLYKFEQNLNNSTSILYTIWFRTEYENGLTTITPESEEKITHVLTMSKKGLELVENDFSEVTTNTNYIDLAHILNCLPLFTLHPTGSQLVQQAPEFYEYLNTLEYLETLDAIYNEILVNNSNYSTFNPSHKSKTKNKTKTTDNNNLQASNLFTILKQLDTEINQNLNHKINHTQTSTTNDQDQNNLDQNNLDNSNNINQSLHDLIQSLEQPNKLVDWIRYTNTKLNPQTKAIHISDLVDPLLSLDQLLDKNLVSTTVVYFILSRMRLNLLIKHNIGQNIRPNLIKLFSKLNKKQLTTLSYNTQAIALKPLLSIFATNFNQDNKSKKDNSLQHTPTQLTSLNPQLILDPYFNFNCKISTVDNLATKLYVGLSLELEEQLKANRLHIKTYDINILLVQQIAQTFKLDLTQEDDRQILSFYYEVIYYQLTKPNTNDFNLVLKTLVKTYGQQFYQAFASDELYEFVTSDYQLLQKLNFKFGDQQLDSELTQKTSLIDLVTNQQRTDYIVDKPQVVISPSYNLNSYQDLDYQNSSKKPLPLFIISCDNNKLNVNNIYDLFYQVSNQKNNLKIASVNNSIPTTMTKPDLNGVTLSLSLAYAQESQILTNLVSRMYYDHNYQKLLSIGSYICSTNIKKLIFPIGGFNLTDSISYNKNNKESVTNFSSVTTDNTAKQIQPTSFLSFEQKQILNQELAISNLDAIDITTTQTDKYTEKNQVTATSLAKAYQQLSLIVSSQPVLLLDTSDHPLSTNLQTILEQTKTSQILNLDSLSKQMFVFLNAWSGVKTYTEQQLAIASSINRNFCCIMGGPGTGKTTTVFNILLINILCQQVLNPNKLYPNISLISPTGKATEHLQSSIVEKTQELINNIKMFNALITELESISLDTKIYINIDPKTKLISDIASFLTTEQFKTCLDKVQAQNFDISKFNKEQALFISYYYLDKTIQYYLPYALTSILQAQAQTIHKQLGVSPYVPNGYYYGAYTSKHNADIVIVDEAGMIELSIMKILTQAYHLQCQLIFLGDANQLPAVGIGYILENLNQQNSPYSITLCQQLQGFGLETRLIHKHDDKCNLSCPQNELVIGDYIHYLVTSYRYHNKDYIKEYSEQVNSPQADIGYTLSKVLDLQQQDIYQELCSQCQVLSSYNSSEILTVNNIQQLIDKVNSKQEIFTKIYEVAYAQYQAQVVYNYNSYQYQTNINQNFDITEQALDYVSKIYVTPTNKEFITSYLQRQLNRNTVDKTITHPNIDEAVTDQILVPYLSSQILTLANTISSEQAKSLIQVITDYNQNQYQGFKLNFSLNGYNLTHLLDQLPINFKTYLVQKDPYFTQLNTILKKQLNLKLHNQEVYQRYIRQAFSNTKPSNNFSLSNFSRILVLKACKQAFRELEILTEQLIKLTDQGSNYHAFSLSHSTQYNTASDKSEPSYSHSKNPTQRDYQFLSTFNTADILDNLNSKDSFNTKINKVESFDDILAKIFNFLNNTKFLCAFRKGKMGVDTLNQLFIEQYKFKDYVPILINQNQENLNLVNGDIGIILPIGKGNIKYAFFNKKENGTYLKVSFEELSNFEYAFFTTIHKSQGDEFDNTHVVLPLELNSFVSRAMFYTAITRVKKRLYLYIPKLMFSTKQLNSSMVQTSLDFNWVNGLEQNNLVTYRKANK